MKTLSQFIKLAQASKNEAVKAQAALNWMSEEGLVEAVKPANDGTGSAYHEDARAASKAAWDATTKAQKSGHAADHTRACKAHDKAAKEHYSKEMQNMHTEKTISHAWHSVERTRPGLRSRLLPGSTPVEENELPEGILSGIKNIFKPRPAAVQKGRLNRPEAPIMPQPTHVGSKILRHQDYHDDHPDPASVPEFKSGPWR